MEQLEYLLKEYNSKQIRRISLGDSFTETYKKYAKFFLDKNHLEGEILNLKRTRYKDKGILLIENEKKKIL